MAQHQLSAQRFGVVSKLQHLSFPVLGLPLRSLTCVTAVSQRNNCQHRLAGRHKAIGLRRRQLACQTMSEVTVQLFTASACHSQALLAYVAAR